MRSNRHARSTCRDMSFHDILQPKSTEYDLALTNPSQYPHEANLTIDSKRAYFTYTDSTIDGARDRQIPQKYLRHD